MEKKIEPLLEKQKVRLEPAETQAYGCAWAGCESEYIGETLPPGWRFLVIAKDSLFRIENLLNADIDSALCPRHVDELGKSLKVGFKLSIAAAEANRSGN